MKGILSNPNSFGRDLEFIRRERVVTGVSGTVEIFSTLSHANGNLQSFYACISPGSIPNTDVNP